MATQSNSGMSPMKMALYGIIAIVLVFVVYIAMQPADFKISRSVVIDAPADKVFAHVNNLKAWDKWSPWAGMDPNATKTFEGPEEGVGAKMGWAGNSDVGEGSMTITESRPSEFIQFQMDFVKPWQSTNFSEFQFRTEGDQTIVTWSFSGTNNFIGKIMWMYSCEKMVKADYDRGLENLKNVVTGK